MMKVNGRIIPSKETAEQNIRTKLFICPRCHEEQRVASVEFGTKYTCPKCGHELLEST